MDIFALAGFVFEGVEGLEEVVDFDADGDFGFDVDVVVESYPVHVGERDVGLLGVQVHKGEGE